MLVVLGISAIVAGLAFAILGLLGRNVQLIQTNYSNNTALSLLEQQITVDLNRYHNISYNSFDNSLKLATPIDSMQYQFETNHIIREEDTVFGENYILSLFYRGEETKSGVIDALKLTIEEDKKMLFFFKQNSTTQSLLNGN